MKNNWTTGGEWEELNKVVLYIEKNNKKCLKTKGVTNDSLLYQIG